VRQELRDAEERYRAAYQAADRARIGTPEFAAAMRELRDAWQKLQELRKASTSASGNANR
jgi:hypothetical protein